MRGGPPALGKNPSSIFAARWGLGVIVSLLKGEPSRRDRGLRLFKQVRERWSFSKTCALALVVAVGLLIWAIDLRRGIQRDTDARRARLDELYVVLDYMEREGLETIPSSVLSPQLLEALRKSQAAKKAEREGG